MLRRPPVFVRRFRDVLWSVAPTRLELPISKPAIQGHRGILHTSRIQYNQDPINILERAHEYTFLVGEQRVELSMQLYLNITDHWRLFAYCNAGCSYPSTCDSTVRRAIPSWSAKRSESPIVVRRPLRDRNDPGNYAPRSLSLDSKSIRANDLPSARSTHE